MHFWTPKFLPEDNIPKNMEDHVYYELTRLENFHSERKIVELLDGVKVIHGSELDSPWGRALKGGDCFTQDQIVQYHRDNGKAQSATVEAYRGSEGNGYEFASSWQNSEYYIESISSGKFGSDFQSTFQRNNLATIIALLITTKGKVYSKRPIKLIQQANTDRFGYTFSPHENNLMAPHTAELNELYVLEEASIEPLKVLASAIFGRRHWEAYLASLRLLRAANRHQPDDGIVDLMIGLEALLNHGKEPGIRLRITQRLSRILNQTKALRRSTSEAIKTAYDFRSALVHGTKRSAEFLEEQVTDKKRKKKLLLKGDLVDTKWRLFELLSDAIFARYVTYGHLDQEELLKKLDDMAL